MTREKFESLQIGDYIHDPKVNDEWKVLDYVSSSLRCECTKAADGFRKGEITTWPIDVHPHFIIGRNPDNVKPQQMTVAEALKQGLKVGDKIDFEFKLMEIDNVNGTYKFVNNLGHFFYLTNLITINFTPQSYIPKHRELCAVVTTTGLTTECEVFESNGRLFAISLIAGKPDGVFCPEQIDKFLPL